MTDHTRNIYIETDTFSVLGKSYQTFIIRSQQPGEIHKQDECLAATVYGIYGSGTLKGATLWFERVDPFRFWHIANELCKHGYNVYTADTGSLENGGNFALVTLGLEVSA
jgi:hypothetical protein